jgi:1-deoxy-D-xylulose-5-phosphate synthase
MKTPPLESPRSDRHESDASKPSPADGGGRRATSERQFDGTPESLRGLSPEGLQRVAEELRLGLINSVANSGGHFASSLGVCELTVALHAAFDTPRDRLVWDVGHQAYIHKMLTGRANRIGSIRTKDGISGFLKRGESEFDTFGAGHAGTSISAAVGMAIGLQAKGEERYVVPVIGDGSITAGMAFEALNHAGALGLKRFIVVLNDNEMSIAPNVGALSWLFSKAVTSKTSNVVRNRFKNLHRAGYVPDVLYRALDRVEDLTQGFFSGAALLFESFGFRYIGPVDGHNMAEVVSALEHAKSQDVPVLLHVYTTKGKGYQPAESDPVKWHGVTPFVPDLGEFLASGKASAPSYTQIFADTLIQLAEKNPSIMAITAAMPSGTGIDKFQERFPTRCFDVGICEQHAVTAAAGMACEGLTPVVAIYSTFLQRAYDQVVHDVAIQNLPVIFAMDRSGVVGNDGETHQGVFDIAAYRAIPNITIMSARDEHELRAMLTFATQGSLTQRDAGPIMIRYPRGNGTGARLETPRAPIEIGRCETLKTGTDVLIVGCGTIVNAALAAANELEKLGVSSTVINARFVKPLDKEIEQLSRSHSLCVTLEDHATMAGFGGAVLELLSDEATARGVPTAPLLRLGLPDEFVAHASQAEQYAAAGLDTNSIVKRILEALRGVEDLAVSPAAPEQARA